MPMFKHFSQPVLGTFTVVSKAISPWHDIRVPEDNLGGNVLLKMTSSKAGQNQVGLLALCSAKLWIFPRMKISQLFQQANLLQCCTAYHSPEMATTKAVHSSQKFSSRALYRNSVLKIQPTAPSPRPQEDGIPGEWKLNTTTKEISQVGTEEDVPVSRCVWAGWAVCGFLPPPAHLRSWWSWFRSRAVRVPLAEGSVFGSHRDLCLQPVPPEDFWLFKISCDPSYIQISFLSQQREESS